MSVVGFDDSALMRFTDPPLTTVRQPIEAMGRAAVERLISQLDGDRDGPMELLYAPELVVRGSTAPSDRRATAAGLQPRAICSNYP